MKGNQKQEILHSYTIESMEQASALLHPIRAEVLSYLKQASSAAEIARQIGESSQKINYHVKALEKVGLVQRVGTRSKRNLVEVLYQSIAKTFIMSDSLGLDTNTMQKAKDQVSLKHLVTIAERIKNNAVTLSNKVDQDEQVPSASLDFSVKLPSEKRQAFVEEYVELVQQLVKKYKVKQDIGNHFEEYEAVLAIYPKVDLEEE